MLETRVHEMIELVTSFKVHFRRRLRVFDLCSSATTKLGDNRRRASELTPQKPLTKVTVRKQGQAYGKAGLTQVKPSKRHSKAERSE